MIRRLLRCKPHLLMLSLVAELVLSPYFDQHPHAGGLAALVVLILVLALASYTAPRWLLRFFVGPLATTWAAARLLEALAVSPLRYAQLSSVLGLALSLTILWLMLHRFQQISENSASVVSEAFISYLVIAICFSQLYEIVDRTSHNAFNRIIPPPRGSALIYFSLVTLSSLGSSDLVAVNPYLRIVTALESLAGVFYIAVVVARLVSSRAQLRSLPESEYPRR